MGYPILYGVEGGFEIFKVEVRWHLLFFCLFDYLSNDKINSGRIICFILHSAEEDLTKNVARDFTIVHGRFLVALFVNQC